MKALLIVFFFIAPTISQNRQHEQIEPTYRVEQKLDTFNSDIQELIYKINENNM